MLTSDKIFLFFYESSVQSTLYAMWIEEMNEDLVKEIAIDFMESYETRSIPNYDEDGNYMTREKYSNITDPKDLDPSSIVEWIEKNWKWISKEISPYDDTGKNTFFIVDKALMEEYADFFSKHYPACRKAEDTVLDFLQKNNPEMVHSWRGSILARKLGIG